MQRPQRRPRAFHVDLHSVPVHDPRSTRKLQPLQKTPQKHNRLFQRASLSSTIPATTAVVKSTTASARSHLAVLHACGSQRPNASCTQLHATVSSGSSASPSERPSNGSIEDHRKGSVHESAKVRGTSILSCPTKLCRQYHVQDPAWRRDSVKGN